MEENIREGYTSNTTKWWAEVGGFTVHSLNISHSQTVFVGPSGAVLHRVLRSVRPKAPNCPTCSIRNSLPEHSMPPMTLPDVD
jgi:hypothetical protein